MSGEETVRVRARRVGTLALAAGLLALPWAPAGATRCTHATQTNRFGTWATIRLPATPRAEIDPDTGPLLYDDSYDVDSFAVDRRDPSTIYVADDWTVMRSTDGGCSWSKSYSILDGGEPEPVADRIHSLVAAPASSSARVYALIRGGGAHPLWIGQPSGAYVPRLGVLDASGEWTIRAPVLSGTGAPLVGHPAQLWAGPSPGRLYMRVYALVNNVAWREDEFSTGALYASDDDGVTWELRGARTVKPYDQVGSCVFDGVCTAVYYSTLVPDPAEPDTVWAAGYDEVLRSTDAGRTWHTLFEWSEHGGNRALCVYHRRGRAAAIVLLASFKMAWSSDAGTTWSTRGLSHAPSEPRCVGPGPRKIAYVDGSYRLRMTDGTRDVDVSLDAHGNARASSTRLRDATYEPFDESFLFIGGRVDNGLHWGRALLRFTPKQGTAR